MNVQDLFFYNVKESVGASKIQGPNYEFYLIWITFIQFTIVVQISFLIDLLYKLIFYKKLKEKDSDVILILQNKKKCIFKAIMLSKNITS